MTSERPNFRGFLELKEILNEEKSGEYLPIFRGNYIRKQVEYKNLFKDFSIERERYFRFSAHKFCSFVLSKKS